MAAEYWVYENWTMSKAAIHYASCGSCKHGKGVHGTTSEKNGRWHGPYNSIADANAAAFRTGQPVRPCGHCRPT